MWSSSSSTLIILLLSRFVSFITASNLVSIIPCSASDSTQIFSVNNGKIGVIGDGYGCLNNNGNQQPLDLQQCVGGDNDEIGYNLTDDGIPRVVEWANNGLCFSILENTDNTLSLPPLLTLISCTTPNLPVFAYSDTTKQILVNPPSSSSSSSVHTFSSSSLSSRYLASNLCLGVYSPPPFLSSIFGNHMVFQSDLPFTMFGSTENTGDTVTITILNNQNQPVIPAQTSLPSNSSSNNQWSITFPSLSKGGPYTFTIINNMNNAQNVTLSDVWIGTLILCSGQSNLSAGNTPVSYIFNASMEIQEANNFSNIRIFQVGTFGGNGSAVPLTNLAYPPRIPWSVASNMTVGSFSATCWLSGKNLALNLLQSSSSLRDSAIGLMESAWGGTSIQPWMSDDAINTCNEELNITAPPPSYPGGWPIYPSTLYNAQIAPFLGLSYNGIIWYQGESNALNNESWYYNCALPTLFMDWRQKFNNPTAWIGVVQLAPWTDDASYNQMVSDLRNTEYTSMMNMQPFVNVTVVTAIDTGDYAAPIGSIHPRDKQPVGRRLGAGAAYYLFKQNNLMTDLPVTIAQSMGPTYKQATSGGKINPASTLSATITFTVYDSSSNQLIMISPQNTGPFANSSVCPSAVPSGDCVSFELQDKNTGIWYPATNISLSSDKTQVIIETTMAPSNAVLGGTANGRGMWPISYIYNQEMVVAFPFEQYL